MHFGFYYHTKAPNQTVANSYLKVEKNHENYFSLTFKLQSTQSTHKFCHSQSNTPLPTQKSHPSPLPNCQSLYTSFSIQTPVTQQLPIPIIYPYPISTPYNPPSPNLPYRQQSTTDCVWDGQTAGVLVPMGSRQGGADVGEVGWVHSCPVPYHTNGLSTRIPLQQHLPIFRPSPAHSRSQSPFPTADTAVDVPGSGNRNGVTLNLLEMDECGVV